MGDDEVTLPDSVRRLWGLAPSAAKRTGLTVERVIEAAVHVADTDGLDAVSMSRVATELGFTTMALYRHVDSKEELLELMRDAASGDPPDLPHDQGWRAAITAWAWAQLEISARRPWILQIIPVAGPPIGPHQVAWMEAGMRALRDSGLPPDERFGLIGILAAYILHEVRFSHEMARHHAGRDQADVEREYGRQLAAVADPARFPELAAALAAGVFETPPEMAWADVDPDFTFGLERLLDGVELLVERRAEAAERDDATQRDDAARRGGATEQAAAPTRRTAPPPPR